MRPSREQVLFLVTFVVCGLLWLGHAPSGGGPKAVVDPAGPRATGYPIVRDAPEVREKAEGYTAGRSIFEPPPKKRLPMPVLALPSPRMEDPALPPFPLSPPASSLTGPLEWEYLYLSKDRPAVNPAAIDRAALDAVLALKLPEDPPRKDMRAEHLPGRELDEVRLVTGAVFRGRIPGDTVAKEVILITEQGQPMRFRMDQVESIRRAMTYEKQYRQDSSAAGEDLHARLRLAERCLQWGMIPEATLELEFVCRRRPQDYQTMRRLVDLLVDQGEIEKALEWLHFALERVEGMDLRALLHSRLGEVMEKIGVLPAALRYYDLSFPSVPEAGTGKARVLYRMGRFPEAADAAGDVLRLPGISEQVEAASLAVRALALLRTAKNRDDVRKAGEDLERAISRQPSGLALAARATIKMLDRDWQGGAADLVAALRQDQFCGPAWASLAVLLLAMGKRQEAEACIRKGLERDPQEAVLYDVLGLLRAEARDAAGAQAHFEKSIELGGGRGFYPYYGMGITLLSQGNPQAAVEKFREALRREFSFAPLYYNTALCLLQGQRPEELLEAESLLREVVARRPTYRNGIVALTVYYLRIGKVAEADAVFGALSGQLSGDRELLYLHALITYLGHARTDEDRVADTRDQLEQAAAAGHPEAGALARLLGEWLQTYVILEDEFRRDDGPVVGAGWNENDHEESFPISLVNQRCRFQGRPPAGAGRDLVYFSLEREIPGEDLYSVEASFYPTAVSNVDVFGLGLFFPQPGGQAWGSVVFLRFDRDLRRPVAGFLPRFSEEQLRKEGRLVIPWDTAMPLDPEEIRVRIRLEHKESVVAAVLEVFDRSQARWVPSGTPRQLQMPRGSFKLSIFVRSRMRSSYEFDVDGVRVLQRATEE